MARTSNTILSESGKSQYLRPVPDLKEKSFSFSPSNRMLPVGFLYMVFIMLKYVPPILTLLRPSLFER